MTSNHEDTHYQKAVRYCAYQERTEKEVQEKLRAWGVKQDEITHIIRTLKQDRFLDEERYVTAFVRGKLLAKKWGKRKLWAVLMERGISQALIQKGLAVIEDTDYIQSLHHVAKQKKQSLADITSMQARQKLINYLLQKGYESDLVIRTVQEMITQQRK